MGDLMWQMFDLDKVKKRAEEEEESLENVIAVRGAWDNFKASVKKAEQKVKNAFGRREEDKREEKRHIDDITREEKKIMKQSYLQLQALVEAMPELANDPEIKQTLAQMPMIW